MTKNTLKTGLLFDFDGVIIISEHLHKQAWHELSKCYNQNIPDDFIYQRLGHTDEKVASDLLHLWSTKTSTSKIVADKRQIYLSLAKNENLLNPGIIEFLEDTVSYPKALCTNSSIKDIENDIIKYALSKYFKIILTCESVKKPKPEPEIYLKAAQLIDVPIENCFIFEDSINGIKAGKATLAKVIGITTHFSCFNKDLVDFSAPNFTDKDKIFSFINKFNHEPLQNF